MSEFDWTRIDEKNLEAWKCRVELVETLVDERIHESERAEIRRGYLREHGVTDRTIRNYLKTYREKGAEGLLFRPGGIRPRSPRIYDQALRGKLLELVEEHPRRTVPQLRRLLNHDPQYAPGIASVSDRTIYRFLSENGLGWRERSAKALDPGRKSFHQFEASAPMELVQGDARDGIWLPDPDDVKKTRKTYLFGWVDDYSRKILYARYYWDEKLPRMEDTFKTMVLRWGIPLKAYLDNGKVYIARHFAFILSRLGIRKIHHKAYQAWSKGKIEAVMKTLKNEFQSEAQQAGFLTLEELNSALWAWIDVEYNRRNHSTTGVPPDTRFTESLPTDHRRVQDLQWFEALFLLREHRTVNKYGVIKLQGNRYRTSVRYGTVIEVRYDPFDLHTVWRFEDGKIAETLAVHTLNNSSSSTIPQETATPKPKVSEAAAGYFSQLRTRQAQLRKVADGPQYSKLIREEKSS